MFDFINKARTEAARTQAAADRANLQNVRADLQTAEENYQNNPNFITKLEFDRQSRVALAMENVRGSAKVLNDITKLSLEATADPLKPQLTLTLQTQAAAASPAPRHHCRTASSYCGPASVLQIEKERFGLTERELELRSFNDTGERSGRAQKSWLLLALKHAAEVRRWQPPWPSCRPRPTCSRLNEQQQYDSALQQTFQQITDLEA